MTAHELARKLLEGPDLPVTYFHSTGTDGGWGDNVLIRELDVLDEPFLSEPVGDDMDGPSVHLS